MKTLHRRILSFILALIAVMVFPLTTVSASGSATGSCIVEIAERELGYIPEVAGVTKYGEYTKAQGDWCASFVAWCADQAGIPTEVIPNSASVPTMVTHFQDRNRYYDSASYGGTTEPQVGDLFFETHKDKWYFPTPGHIGIIVAVDSDYIYTVEGNCGGRVAQRAISKNSDTFVAFARPAYTSSYTTVTYQTTDEGCIPVCGDCGLKNAIIPHSFTGYDCDGMGHTPICSDCGFVNWDGFGEHVYRGTASGHSSICSICGFGYSDDIEPHIYGNAYDYSDTFHWKICLVCEYPHSTRTVHIFTEDMTTGINTCEICGYEYNPYLTHENDGPEHLIE